MKFGVAKAISCALSIQCYFSFAKMIQAGSQKQKAAAVELHSCLSSAANCGNFFLTCNEMKQINGKRQNGIAGVEVLSV